MRVSMTKNRRIGELPVQLYCQRAKTQTGPACSSEKLKESSMESPVSALHQETGDLGRHVVKHVEQLVIGVENLQRRVGMAGRKLA